MSRFTRALLTIASVVCISLPTVARAEDEGPLKLDTSVAVVSDYMFRGYNLYDGIGIQPTATLSYDTGFGVLSGGLWMHLSAEGDRQDEKFTELDETLTYSYTFGALTAKAGFIWYTYPDSGDDINDTTEVTAGLSFDDSEYSPFTLNPTLTFYRDFRDLDYTWWEITVSHLVETDALGKGFNMTPYLQLGFADSADDLYESDGLETMTLGTTFATTLGDINVTPGLYYTFEVDDATVNEFWISVAFGYSI